MKESILERSLINANTVTNVLVEQEMSGNMKESILERSLMNANTVASVLVKERI